MKGKSDIGKDEVTGSNPVNSFDAPVKRELFYFSSFFVQKIKDSFKLSFCFNILCTRRSAFKLCVNKDAVNCLYSLFKVILADTDYDVKLA